MSAGDTPEVSEIFPSVFKKNKNNEEKPVQVNKDIVDIFKLFKEHDASSLFSHCVIACNDSSFFVYVTEISSIFVENVKKIIKETFSEGDISEIESPVKLIYNASRCKTQSGILRNVKREIKKRSSLLFFHWFIIQFNIEYFQEILFSSGFPLDEESKQQLCERIVKERIIANNNRFSRSSNHLLSHVKMVMVKERLRMESLKMQNDYRNPNVIRDSRPLVDDET
jgi:hypothetical protein